MSTPLATHPRAAYDALAYGSPLAALRAHAKFLRAPRRSRDIGFLRTLAGSGDRLACALAIRPLARIAEGDFDTELHAFARGGDPLLREQAVWALADRPATIRILGWDAVIASGATDPHRLGPSPCNWVVEEHLPQVAALEVCEIVVCHGGNNTVTETLTAGLPVLAAPFSTDQFAGAEDLRRAGLGDAIDPNAATVDEIAARLASLIDGSAPRRAASLGAELRDASGAEVGADILEAAMQFPRSLPEPFASGRLPGNRTVSMDA